MTTADFAFWASLLLSVLKISEYIIKLSQKPELDLTLTPEIFFRLIDSGETLFCNTVLLAWNGPVLIMDAEATLEKIDSPKKSFRLKIDQFGEKVKGVGPIAEHYFHSRSPISYVPESKPSKAVFLCVQENYQDDVTRTTNKFQSEILEIKNEMLSRAAGLDDKKESDLRREMYLRLNEIIERNLGELFQYVQIEQGDYQLKIKIKYTNPKSKINRGIKETESNIRFRIEDHARGLLYNTLRETLRDSAQNTILDKNDPITYPEYAPIDRRTC